MARPFRRYFLTVAVFFAAIGLVAERAVAAETIRHFNATIAIAEDGELTVTETIRVRAEGVKIRRGIYRDFPLVFEDAEGKERRTGFELLSVTRDGVPESHHTERGNRSLRIYLGDADSFLPTGEYTYQITYRSDRQIRFFDDHDELLWNVTGNFWTFPIERASARVTLPPGATATDLTGYTGTFGSKAQAVDWRLADNGNSALFETTKPLGEREGLTIGVKFPKGVVQPPSDVQAAAWWLRDRKGEILAVLLLVGISVYYLFNWWRIGRDPPKGVMVPRWDPPEGISPALTNYIDRKGLSGKGWDAISAAILNLAVKGYVNLGELDDNVRITATGRTPPHPLPVGEAAIFRELAEAGGDLKLSRANSIRVKNLQTAFAKAMNTEHRSKFYQHNHGTLIIGLAMSLAGMILLIFLGGFGGDAIGLTIMLAVAALFITLGIVRLVRAFTEGRGLSARIQAIIFTCFIAYLAFSIMTGLISQAFDFIDRPVVISTIVGLVMLNALFFFLMGAPTSLGRKMADGIEGLKTYIRLAETDRMNLAGAPQMSPEHFETLLPYAVALRLEKPWSNAFEKWLATAVAAGAVASTWQPDWYGGRSFDPGSAGKTIGSISDSIQTSLTESMPAPKSSSSGFSGDGGGFSGGGGGGGGGGGW